MPPTTPTATPPPTTTTTTTTASLSPSPPTSVPSSVYATLPYYRHVWPGFIQQQQLLQQQVVRSDGDGAAVLSSADRQELADSGFQDPLPDFKLTDSMVSGLFAAVCLGTVGIAYWKTKRSYVKELHGAEGVLEADIMEGQRLAAKGLLIATALTTGSFSALIFAVSSWMQVGNMQEFSAKAKGSLKRESAAIDGWFKDINIFPSAKSTDEDGGGAAAERAKQERAASWPDFAPKPAAGGGAGGDGEAQPTQQGGLAWWANYFQKRKEAAAPTDAIHKEA